MDYRGLVADRLRRRTQHRRLPAVGDVGLERSRDDRAASSSAPRCWSCSSSSSCGRQSPLIDVSIFRIRPSSSRTSCSAISNLVFIPVFFFASEYAQISLGKSASSASLVLLYFFLGFVVAAQIGGRMLDRDRGQAARRPRLRARRRRLLALGGQGHGPRPRHAGLVHRPRRARHGLHARPGQHRRRQPRLAALLRRGDRHHPDGPELRREPRARGARQPARLADALPADDLARRARALPHAQASAQASKIAQSQGGGGTGAIPHFVRLDFAYATRSVLYAMAGIMAVAAVVALFGLRRGVQVEPERRSQAWWWGRLSTLSFRSLHRTWPESQRSVSRANRGVRPSSPVVWWHFRACAWHRTRPGRQWPERA